MKKIFITLLFVIVLLAGCSTSSNSSTTQDYDKITLKDAKSFANVSGFSDKTQNEFVNGNRIFEVTINSKGEYILNVNGTEMRVQIPKKSDPEAYKPLEISDVRQKYNKIISSSINLISRYIEGSTILTDKDEIKKYVSSIAVKEAIFTEESDVGAYFSPTDDTLYINKNNVSCICEWMIVHEYVHAVCYCTHGFNIEKEEYAYNLFNEVMTDLIVNSLNPKMVKGALSSYTGYYTLVYPYIHIFGKDALKAYFYGYEFIYKKVPINELNFLVVILENWGSENASVYYNNIIYKWYAAKENFSK